MAGRQTIAPCTVSNRLDTNVISLAILGIVLLAAWLWGVWERDRRASFMRDWVHAVFVAAITVLVMAATLWIR